MKSKLSILLTLCCLGGISGSVDAQKAKTVSLSLVPINLFVGSLRLDGEIYLKKSKHALVFSPQYYFADTESALKNDNQKVTHYSGGGVELQHKIYLDKIEAESLAYKERLYFAYGFSYHRFNHQYQANSYYSYVEDGITYYSYGLLPVVDHINRYRMGIYIGVQRRTGRFVFDAYSGVSYQITEINYESDYSYQDREAAYKNSFLNYGYQGLKPRLGFKIGFFLF